MKQDCQIIIVGKNVFGDSVLNFRVENATITQIPITIRRKNYVLHLRDELSADDESVVPLAQCLLAGNHIVATSLIYKDEEAKKNDSEPTSSAIIHLDLFVADQRSFSSRSEAISSIRDQYQKQIKGLLSQISRMDEEFTARYNSIVEPFRKIIEDKEKEVQKQSQKVTAVWLESNARITQILKDAIMDDLTRDLGLSEQMIDQKTEKFYISKQEEIDTKTKIIQK